MELFSPGHLIPLLIVVAVLFFGWKQLPDMARSVGRSLRIFKTEMKGMGEDDAEREAKKTVTAAPVEAAAQPVAEQPPVAQAPVAQVPVAQVPVAQAPAAPVAPAPAAEPASQPITTPAPSAHAENHSSPSAD